MHYLSIMAIFKNETFNLKIWIEHYLWQGIQHFYLIDNNSSDNPLDILQPYIDSKLVNYYFRPKQHDQINHYRTIYAQENLKLKTKWLIIADLDEFFFGLKLKICNILPKLHNYDILYCNWLMFGSDGLIDHPNDIRTAIIFRNPNYHENKKYIFQTKNINASQILIHHIEPANKFYKKLFINNLIHLNHYPIQSLNYFKQVKMTRGDVDTFKSDKIRDLNYFKEYDKNNTIPDDYLKKLIELNR